MGPGLPQGPCQRPPWGRLTAVNAATGEFAWQITLGVTDGLPPEKQNTGRGGSAGPMVTAGGLVFIGTTSDARFRAIDSKTGKELFVTKLNATGSATPMTYQGRSGKQYVVQAAAGTLNVFALALEQPEWLCRRAKPQHDLIESVAGAPGDADLGACQRRHRR